MTESEECNMILENLKGLEILENLLNNEKIKVDTIYSEHVRSIGIELNKNYSYLEKNTLAKKLEKIHLKLQRSADYYSPYCKLKEYKYEISPVDGEGNDIISTYSYKHKKEREKNPFRDA